MEGIFSPEWAGYGAVGIALVLLVWHEWKRRAEREVANQRRLGEVRESLLASGLSPDSSWSLCGKCEGAGTRPGYSDAPEACPWCEGHGVVPRMEER